MNYMRQKIFFLTVLLLLCNDISLSGRVNNSQAPNVSLAIAKSEVKEEDPLLKGGSNLPVEDVDIATGVKLEPQETVDDSGQPADIYLNFENSSLASIVNYLAERKKINIVPHRDLEATMVSLTTREPLTLNRAWNVLLTLMEINAFSIVKVGELYRIIASRDSGMEPLPVYSSGNGVEPENLPANSKVIRYVYFLKSMKADIAQQILRTMLEGDNNTILVNRDLNACIIKQQSLNIKAAMKIIKELDGSGLKESLRVVPLKHTNADMVVRIFDEILGAQPQQDRVIKFSAFSQQKETSYFSSSTRIIPEPVKNSLILMGAEKHLDRITTFIKEKIDVPLGDAQSRLHIREIKHAQAERLKPILENIIRPPRGQGSERSSLVGEFKFFEDVIISAEEPKDERSGFGGGNRLIIACNNDDWIRLNKIIDKLDTPQPQVALEVMVIDTNIDETNFLGAQMHNIKGRPFGMGIDTVTFNNLADGTALTSADSPQLMDVVEAQGIGGPSFLTFGRPGTVDNPENNNLWGIVRARCNLDNSHIITQPFLVANNYQPCSVKVSEERLVPGELVDGSRTGETRRRKEPIRATTLLEITPKINRDGMVELDLFITLGEFGESLSTDQPPRTKRELKTRVLLSTGEVIALGGFLSKEKRIEEKKTPLLSRIPIIGTFFRTKDNSQRDKNVYVFIRPSIIKPRFEGAPDEYTQLKLDYAKYQSTRHDTYAKEKDPIQRWFFKPRDQTVKHTIADARRGVYRPIDDYTYGKNRPSSVNVRLDPYYKVSEEVKREREKVKLKSLKRGGRSRVKKEGSESLKQSIS